MLERTRGSLRAQCSLLLKLLTKLRFTENNSSQAVSLCWNTNHRGHHRREKYNQYEYFPPSLSLSRSLSFPPSPLPRLAPQTSSCLISSQFRPECDTSPERKWEPHQWPRRAIKPHSAAAQLRLHSMSALSGNGRRPVPFATYAELLEVKPLVYVNREWSCFAPRLYAVEVYSRRPYAQLR